MSISWIPLSNKRGSAIALESFLAGCLKECRTGCFFRGQGDASWALVPSGFRDKAGKLVTHAERDRRLRFYLSDSFRSLASELRELVLENEKVEDHTSLAFKNLQLLVIAQHFGIPTPLLDLTKSPLIALFMATAFRPEENATVGIYKFETALIPSDDAIWQMYSSVGFQRIESQLGGVFCFGKLAQSNIQISSDTAEEYSIRAGANQFIFKVRVKIKKTEYFLIREMLESNGVTLDRLFPKSSHWFSQLVKQKLPWDI